MSHKLYLQNLKTEAKKSNFKVILSKIANSLNHIQICPQNQAMLHPSMLKTAIYTTYFVSEVEQLH